MPAVIPPLRPRDIALVTGDYGTGKSTLIGAWVQSLGRGVLWAAPQRLGQQPDYASFAAVVHSRLAMERACREHSFVVWPSPPSSAGAEVVRSAFNDFCEVSMQLRHAVVVCDEVQRILGDSKRLIDAPPAFQDLVELGHKAPGELAKVFCAHRLAQIPLNLGAGAYRVSTRPFPGDEGALEPFFAKDGVQRMKRFGVGDFAFWSAELGPIMPCRLTLGSAPRAPPAAPPAGPEDPGGHGGPAGPSVQE